MKRVVALIVTLTLGLVVALSAAQGPVFRSTSLTVPIYATVTDSTGRLVPDLLEEHFEVYDNGVRQPLTIFKSDVQPITVVMMLDTSGSMTANLQFLKDAAERFVVRLLPEDRARVGSFSDKIRISPRFTSNRDDLIRIIHNDIQFGNPTFLWDATDASMSALAEETGRRVVLLFTDGEDAKSERMGFDDVFTRARNQDFMIYAIGLHGNVLGRPTRPDRNLRQLAEQTGGGFFELRRTADLNSTFTRVADELHRQYVLGFSIDKLDGLVHKLDVRVKVPGMTVRARKTYVASTTGEPAPGAPRRPR
jgi:Ca-activated chloride channel family protein